MFEKINEGVFTLFNAGGFMAPYEYSGYKEEILASKFTAYLGTALNESPVFDVKGPEAAKFLSSVCVNDFTKMKEGTIRHAIMCNEKGQIMTDGVVMMIGENHFRTYWLMPVIDYLASISDMDIEGVDLTGKEFFFQIAGPKSLEILENAAKCDLHDIKFAKHRVVKIAGVDCRILRLGMAGTLAYEFHGDMMECDKVYEAVWTVAEKYGAKKLGRIAYCMNHTEGGFPNINMHYPLPWFEDEGLAAYLAEHPMEGFYNWNRQLIGSVGNDLEIRFKTPYDVDWGFLVNFNHEFTGKAALQEIAKNPKTQLVTLEWNPDDLGEVFASQFRGREVEPYDSMDDRPMDMYYKDCARGFVYHADKVMDGDKMIGISTGRLNSVYYRRMISLGFIDKEYAVEGKEYTVIWGTPGRPQLPIRVKVVRTPYMDLENNKEIDVETIPHYCGE